MTAAITSAPLDGAADTPSDQGPWQILGRTIGLPVEVRSAAQWGVQYLVPAAAAQRIVGPTGLQVTGPLPGKALVALAVCRYDDTDLDSYHEVAVSFVVRPHDAPPRSVRPATGPRVRHRCHRRLHPSAARRPGVHLCGRPGHLGLPQVDDHHRHRRARPGRPSSGSGTTIRLVDDGAHVLTLTLAGGGPVKLPSQAPPSYSFRDGVLRRTPWEMSADGVAGRPGGATLVLGDHPMADELRSLGLPKRALFSSSAARMRASFGAAEVVSAER